MGKLVVACKFMLCNCILMSCSPEKNLEGESEDERGPLMKQLQKEEGVKFKIIGCKKIEAELLTIQDRNDAFKKSFINRLKFLSLTKPISLEDIQKTIEALEDPWINMMLEEGLTIKGESLFFIIERLTRAYNWNRADKILLCRHIKFSGPNGTMLGRDVDINDVEVAFFNIKFSGFLANEMIREGLPISTEERGKIVATLCDLGRIYKGQSLPVLKNFLIKVLANQIKQKSDAVITFDILQSTVNTWQQGIIE